MKNNYTLYEIIEDEFLFKFKYMFKSVINADLLIKNLMVLIKFFQIESKLIKEEFKKINVIKLKIPDSDEEVKQKCKIEGMPFDVFIKCFYKIVQEYDKFYKSFINIDVEDIREINNIVFRYYCFCLKDNLIENNNDKCLNRMHVSSAIKKTLKICLHKKDLGDEINQIENKYLEDEGYKSIKINNYMKHTNLSMEDLVNFAYEYVLKKLPYY